MPSPQHVIIFSQRTMTMALGAITHVGDVCTCEGLHNPWNQVIFELTSETKDDALELAQEDFHLEKVMISVLNRTYRLIIKHK